MPKLFISYRSLDSAKVDTLVARLRSLKNADGSPRYTTWQDKTDIPVGQDWWKAIVRAIIDCEIFVYMLSRESAQNVNCRAELSYARKRNRPIIPIVLEGEFEFNPKTGKNDILYWEQIPEELKDGRFQFLFYEGVSFVEQLNQAVEKLAGEGFRDLYAPEPPDPRHVDDATNNTAVIYDQAVDFAWKLEFAAAEKLFLKLLDWGDKRFGSDAGEWIEILRQYEELVRLDELAAARYQIPDLLGAYLQYFPKRFVEMFDPKDFRSRYARKDSSSSINASLPIPSSPRNIDPPRPPPLLLPRKPSVEQLPPPFSWIPISPGTVALSPQKGRSDSSTPKRKPQTFDVSAFLIAKYPVTNAQFRQFWEEKGYENRRWWTQAGWEQREADGWTEPRFWNDTKWNGDEQPVVGISWYEAVAYCNWLSEVTGEAIMLPTEQQWQRAAQGDKAYIFPWGPEWDTDRCNNNIDGKGTGGTTSVQHYEGKGDSPFGVVDVAGNVWEWCRTALETGSDLLEGTDVRVLRGGSWRNSNLDAFRCDFRNGSAPHGGDTNRGFRLVRSQE